MSRFIISFSFLACFLAALVIPASAMSDILDRGSLVFASVSVIVLSWLLGHTIRGLLLSFYSPLLILAAIYVPGVLVISGFAGRFAGGLSVRRCDGHDAVRGAAHPQE